MIMTLISPRSSGRSCGPWLLGGILYGITLIERWPDGKHAPHFAIDITVFAEQGKTRF